MASWKISDRSFLLLIIAQCIFSRLDAINIYYRCRDNPIQSSSLFNFSCSNSQEVILVESAIVGFTPLYRADYNQYECPVTKDTCTVKTSEPADICTGHNACSFRQDILNNVGLKCNNITSINGSSGSNGGNFINVNYSCISPEFCVNRSGYIDRYICSLPTTATNNPDSTSTTDLNQPTTSAGLSIDNSRSTDILTTLSSSYQHTSIIYQTDRSTSELHYDRLSTSLGAGEIVAIVLGIVGVVIVVSVLGLLAVMFIIRRRKHRKRHKKKQKTTSLSQEVLASQEAMEIYKVPNRVVDDSLASNHRVTETPVIIQSNVQICVNNSDHGGRITGCQGNSKSCNQSPVYGLVGKTSTSRETSVQDSSRSTESIPTNITNGSLTPAPTKSTNNESIAKRPNHNNNVKGYYNMGPMMKDITEDTRNGHGKHDKDETAKRRPPTLYPPN